MELGLAYESNNHYNHGADGIQFQGKKYLTVDELDDVKDLEETRKEAIRLLRELRQKHPEADLQTLEQMANYEALNNQSKSRAFYRIQATRKMCGAGNILKKTLEKKRASVAEVKIEAPEEDTCAHVYFDPSQYTVMENVGLFNISVTREGGDMNSTIYVDYNTEDGTANAGSDYHAAHGTLIFRPGETQKDISLTIIDDDIFEEDEHFFVRLANIRAGGPDGMFHSSALGPQAQIVEPSLATITILDDDHSGIFHFEEVVTKVPESVGVAQFKVVRSAGARGTVILPYRTVEGTAKGVIDYVDVEGEIVFENDETWKFIEVAIVDDEEYEKDENFFIELGKPHPGSKDGHDSEPEDNKVDEINMLTEEDKRIAEMGRPQLGEIARLEVKIMESSEFKNTVDKLIKKTNLSLVVGTSSWREQFVEALTVSAGGDDDDEDDEVEEKLPSFGDYIMHFLTIFWKVLFAFVPPTDYFGGWACFTVSITWIAVLTALIGDLASMFGCTIGLRDTVTAISFVALGTSVPDTFASKVAAVGDKYADASIGNVTGSNAVNVFLGIGVAWTLAAFKHLIDGNQFCVDRGSLGFSVTIFTCFAIISIVVLMFRRVHPKIGAELGGPWWPKVFTSIFFFCLWLLYIIISSLESYGVISGF